MCIRDRHGDHAHAQVRFVQTDLTQGPIKQNPRIPYRGHPVRDFKGGPQVPRRRQEPADQKQENVRAVCAALNLRDSGFTSSSAFHSLILGA